MNNRGFTLIELIISLGISSIVLLCAFNVISFNLNFYNILKNKSELYQQSISMRNFIEEQLYLCRGVDSVVTLNNTKIDFKNVDEENIKELRIKQVNTGSIWYDNKKKKVFFRKSLSDTGYEIGDYVQNIKVKNLNDKGVKIYLNLSKDNQKLEENFDIFFRNL